MGRGSWRERARSTLWDDVVTDYDARFLSAYLHALPHVYTQAFVLDHEDGVYDQGLMEDARRALLRQVRRAAVAALDPCPPFPYRRRRGEDALQC